MIRTLFTVDKLNIRINNAALDMHQGFVFPYTHREREIVNLAFAETIIYNRDNYSYLNPSLDNEEHTRNTVRIGKKQETTRAKVQKREETMEQISTERKKKNRDKSIDD